MNKTKKTWNLAKKFLTKSRAKAAGTTVALMAPMAVFANTLLENQDITSILMDTALGKTIGKTGMIWGVLITVAILVAAGRAAIANDPRKFLPGIIVAGGIAAAVGMIIT